VLTTAATLVAAVVASGPAAAGRAPDEWDRRVRRFVAFVERERGLDFEHPAKVRFLDDAAFEEALREGEEPPTAEEQALDEQQAGELVALGLAAARPSPEAAEDDADASTVGYYDSETEELVMRGTDLDDVDVRVTIVHELVHALQDQHYDMDALYESTTDDGEAAALDFLIEGDATAVETAYIDSLPPRVQDEYYESGSGGELEAAAGPVEGVPYVLDLFGDAPYALGEAYVAALDQVGGKDARDRAFRDLPTTEEVTLDPVALEHDEGALKVPTPQLRDGEIKARGAQPVGVTTLYLMLATRLGPRAALDAITGWGGDRSIGFTHDDGAACLRFAVMGDTRLDTDELEVALTGWSSTMPAGAVTVARDAAVVTVTACEAAGATEPTVEAFDRAFYNVLGSRVYTVLDVAASGIPLSDARCIGDRVNTDPAVMAIYDRVLFEGSEVTEADQAVVDDAFVSAGDRCGDRGGPAA